MHWSLSIVTLYSGIGITCDIFFEKEVIKLHGSFAGLLA